MSFRSPVATDFRDAELTTESQDTGSFSVIDRFSVFDGTFRADRDLRIEGEVKGTIDCNGTLFVAQGATVSAKVEAENIAVAGELSGEIECRGRLQLLPSGRLRGKVNTSALVINEGAIYEGQLSMAKNSNGRTASAPRNSAASAGPVTMTPPPKRERQEPPPRENQPEEPSAPGALPSTFIRRLGGPETPWSADADGDSAQVDSTEAGEKE
jgi:cytoskeletal protein CcmA (bactofilin family)